MTTGDPRGAATGTNSFFSTALCSQGNRRCVPQEGPWDDAMFGVWTSLLLQRAVSGSGAAPPLAGVYRVPPQTQLQTQRLRQIPRTPHLGAQGQRSGEGERRLLANDMTN